MTTPEYEAYVESRCKPYVTLNYTIIALNGEAGEVAEWYKKYVLRENPTGELTPEDLQKELGDVLFYLTRCAALNGWTLAEIMDANKTKLDRRVEKKMRSIV